MMRCVAAVMIALAVSACGDAEWRTKDIGGLMPPLEFTLTGEQGGTLTEQRFDDQVTVLFFGFTFCPDVCPNTLARLAAVIDGLPADQREAVRVLFVSVDPKRDDPARLAAYTGAFGPRFVGATGSQEQLRVLTKRYRVTYGYGESDASGNYNVSHASAIFVFDRDGEARLLMREDDSVEAMRADIARLLS